METTVSSENLIQIEKVFNPIKLVTESGEVMYICMRDSGFEFSYQGENYYAKEGNVDKFSETKIVDDSLPTSNESYSS